MKFRLRQRTVSAITYDASMGASVDADGFTALPLRLGANRYFVGSGGSDANTGLSHAQRFATLDKPVSLLTSGNGDQILIAEGTTLAETIPQGGDSHGWTASWPGFSTLYPTVYSSYDPADPLNEAKYGRGDQRNARPVLTRPSPNLLGNGTYAYIAVKGLDFNSGNNSGQGLAFVGAASYILIENNIIRYAGLSYDTGEAQTVAPTAQHFIVRNNSIYGAWEDNAANHIGAIYCAGNASPTIEDNVLWHSGWRIGASRDDNGSSAANGGSGLGGGPTVFNHPIYLQTNTANAIVRRNLFMDNAADAGIARGDNTLWTQNVALRSPAGTGLGGGPDYNTERPNGVFFEASHNLNVAAIDLNSTNPSGYGYTTSNGKTGSSVHHNLMIYSQVEAGVNAIMFSNSASFNQPSYAAFQNNIGFHWNGATSYYAAGGAFPSQALPFTSYDNNSWDSAASGTNVFSQSLTFPNAYTEASLCAAAGVTDYATLVSLATAAPEQHYQRTLRSIAFAGYGLS